MKDFLRNFLKNIDWLSIPIAFTATSWELIVPRNRLNVIIVIIIIYILIDFRDYVRRNKKS